MLESLLLHGRFIRSHLEWSEARGNHYLSDVVGLLAVAALFSGGREGRDWAQWASRELVAEMEHQVRPDGSAHEASTSYHRLVTELFVCGTQAADALVPGSLPDWYRERLELMLDFVRDYTRPDGLAPLIGDADDGRFLPLGDYGADPRDHRHLFAQAGRSYEPADRERRLSRRRLLRPARAAASTRSSAAATSGATGEEATATTTSSRSSSPRAAGRS